MFFGELKAVFLKTIMGLVRRDAAKNTAFQQEPPFFGTC